VQTLSKQSSELNLKLEEVEKQLVISMQELQNSKLSLESAKNLQEKTRTSLTELTEQINEERAKQEAIQQRLRVQRTFAYILLALAVASK
jgi:chromosome segregation ATPase